MNEIAIFIMMCVVCGGLLLIGIISVIVLVWMLWKDKH